MRVHYRSKDGRFSGDWEGDMPEIVAGIAQFQEVLEADTTCGCCGQANLRFRVRTVDDNRFTELVCQDCRAVLSFGQTKRGNQLYAKRKEGDRYLPDRGWKVWAQGTSSREPSAGSRTAATSRTAASEPVPPVAAKW